MKLTTAQVYALALEAGFTGEAAITMTAIVAAESGNHTGSVGDVDLKVSGERSIGLGQINYRPLRDQGDPIRDPHANLDPLTNLRHCYAISSKGRSFHPWSTFTNGAYRHYLAVARAAAAKHAATVPPKGHPVPVQRPEPAVHRTYVVRAGDTLGAIAKAHHTTVDAILRSNLAMLDGQARRHGKSSSHHGDLIFPGTVIRL